MKTSKTLRGRLPDRQVPHRAEARRRGFRYGVLCPRHPGRDAVALKIPHESALVDGAEADLHREIRLAAKLQHPHILPLKNADVLDGRLVLVYPLGDRTLADRIRSRLSLPNTLELADQMLAAVAFAHEQRVIHCDIKPENMILCNGRLMLADFGIAKIAIRTIRASGSGTIGYCAPEQAMGQPSFRSDVFSSGLVIYRMLSGRLPEWPFSWPPAGIQRLRSRVHADLIELLRKSIEIDPRKRFANGATMLQAFHRVKPRAVKRRGGQRQAKALTGGGVHWKSVQWRQFQRLFKKALETKHQCGRCGGPVSEAMTHCPWCGAGRKVHDGESHMPVCCPRCHRGAQGRLALLPLVLRPRF